ncbi:MAG TPA: YidB family protein [Streptosporangiaceae bacterium]|jgi:uncharacterized protein YidB (DUF937 family)
MDEITTKLGGQQGQEGGIASLQKMMNSSGGLHGLTQKLQQGGLGKQVQSWIGSGQNQQVSGEQVHQAMDPQQMQQMSQQSGMSDEETCDCVAQALPHMVNNATPQGQMPAPEQDPLSKGISGLRQMLKVKGSDPL